MSTQFQFKSELVQNRIRFLEAAQRVREQQDTKEELTQAKTQIKELTALVLDLTQENTALREKLRYV